MFLNEVRQAKSGPSYRYVCSGRGWYDLGEYIIYRREAAQLIEGQTEAFDKIVADYVEEGRRELARRTPELAAYDETVAYHHDLPRAWRARARRLIELARWDEATRDLDHALSLKNDDPRTWIAYAEYWLARGNADEMAKSVLQAVNNLAADPSELTQQELATLLGRVDDAIVGAVEPAARAELLIVLARHAADAGKIPEAEQYYQQALDADAQNTSVWIARGRFFAERGEQEKAEADFAKAASLTPNELGKFLEGGWWVVGPYAPYLLEECCPPEREADPSKKVDLFDSRTLLPPTPASWSHVPTGREGRVDPAFRVPQMNDCSAYAMTYIYSPDARTATLWVGGKSPLGVWLNGTYVQSVTTPDLWEHLLPRVPVALRAGRNMLLVKVSGGADARRFFVRLGDHPVDRGFEAARYCRWREAAADLAEVLERNPAASDHVWRYQALFALAAGDTDEFRRRVTTLLAQYKDSPNDEVRFSLGHLCSFAQDPLIDHQTLVRFVEKGPNSGSRHAWNKLYVGLAYYRAGRWQDAIDAVAGIGGSPVETQPVAWPILAMANHQLQRKEEAAGWLQKSVAWITSCANDPRTRPWLLLEAYLLSREAATLITGSAADVEAKFQAVCASRQGEWQTRDPATADFDDAVRMEPRMAWPYVARGRRLAELDRDAAAEAEFNHAVELQPADPDALAARIMFRAEPGDADNAAAHKHAALRAFGYDNYRWSWFCA